MQSQLVNPIIDLERPLEKVLKKGEYITIKSNITPGDNDSGSYEINLLYYGGGSPEEWLVWKDKLFKASDGQSISIEPQRYMFTERLLIGDAKAICNQAVLDIGVRIVFNKVLAEMSKHAFPAYVFCEQKKYLHRHIFRSRCMQICSFISRLASGIKSLLGRISSWYRRIRNCTSTCI